MDLKNVDFLVEHNQIHVKTLLVGACAAATQWAKALEVATMVTAATLGAAIVACEAGGAWEHAVALLQQMQRSRLEADDIAFRAAMGACHSTVAMRWERSVDLLQRMQCTGVMAVSYKTWH